MKQTQPSFARREAVILRREARAARFWGAVERATGSWSVLLALGVLLTGALVYALHAPVARLLTGSRATMFTGQALACYIAAATVLLGATALFALHWLDRWLCRLRRARLCATNYRRWADHELAANAVGVDTLREIADTSQNSWTRERAARRIQNQAALRVLALTGAHDDARSEAALALGDPDVCLAMLPTLTDPAARERIASILQDQPALARLARDDPHERVRRAALQNVRDPQTLAHTLLSDASPALRLLAAQRLQSAPPATGAAAPDAQRLAAAPAPAGEQRATAGTVSPGTPPASQNPAKPDGEWPAAVRRAINRAALTDADERVRAEAAMLVTDQRVLGRLAQQGRSENVRRRAVARLTDQAALAQVAFTEPDVSIRCDAIRKIESQQTLFTIASEDQNEQARLAAVSGLFDQTLLLRLLLTGNTGMAVAEALLARLHTRDALQAVAQSNLPDTLRARATLRLHGAPHD